MENSQNNIKTQEINEKTYVDENKSSKKEEDGYLGYYLFVAISAVLGFFSVFFLTEQGIKVGNEKGITNITSNVEQLSLVAAVISVVFFMFITIIFKKFWKKIFFTEIFLYLYIGFLTTVISIVVFAHFNVKFNQSGEKGNLGWLVAEILSFVIAVTFAFVCDKIVVFRSLNFRPKKIATEFGLFVGGRLVSEGIAIVLMYILINVLGNKELFAKFIVALIVIILNYLLSKFIIFRKTNKKEEKIEDGSINEESN